MKTIKLTDEEVLFVVGWLNVIKIEYLPRWGKVSNELCDSVLKKVNPHYNPVKR